MAPAVKESNRGRGKQRERRPKEKEGGLPNTSARGKGKKERGRRTILNFLTSGGGEKGG